MHFFDLDFKLDYTNNKFKVYHNGTEITATNTTAGSYSGGYALKNDTSTSANFLAKNMTGWEIFGQTAAPTASEGAIIHTMIDRAALYIPLTDPADGTKLPPPVKDWSCNLSTNSSSIGNVTILDDDSEHNLTSFFLDDEVIDWKVLMFSGNIDRPLWQGVIDSVKIKQAAKGNTREIKITARDSLGLMDKQMTSWELGQIGMGDSDTVLARRSEVTKLAETMHLGTAKLDSGDNTLGFESDTGYKELHNQRMSVHSANPIQMYNNEDTYGPNNAENEWLGFKMIGTNKTTGGDLEFLYDMTTVSAFKTASSIDDGDSITISGSTTHDGSHTLEGSNGVSTAFGLVGGANSRHHVSLVPTSGTYTANTSANLLRFANFHPQVSTYATPVPWFVFETEPTHADGSLLEVGDYIVLPEYEHTSASGSQNNKGIFKISDILTSVISQQDPTPTRDLTTIYGTRYAFCTEDAYSASGGFDQVPNDTTNLSGGSSLVYTTHKGFTKKSTPKHEIESRVVQAVWMRDLAKSRWFRKHFGIYGYESERVAPAPAVSYITADVTADADKIRVDEAFFGTGTGTGWQVTSGVGQIIDADGFVDTFTYLGAIIDDEDGLDYLVGVSGLSKSHSSGAVIESMKISEDYKHIWLLWSDMRNNGHASADGGFRKNEFGLLQPPRDNYELNINFTDQYDEEGKYDAYTDLKIGADVDLWEIDSEVDPATGTKFSMPLEDRTDEVRQTRNVSGDCIVNASGKAKLYASTTAAHGVSGLTAGDYIYIFNNTTYKGLHKINSISSNDITLDTAYTSDVTYSTSAAY